MIFEEGKFVSDSRLAAHTIAFFALRRFKKTKSTGTRARSVHLRPAETLENTKTGRDDSIRSEHRNVKLLSIWMTQPRFLEPQGHNIFP
jgi:hypothetical protein